MSPHETHKQDGGLLTVEEAAYRLRLSESSLNKWRVSGNGPAFIKLGRRIFYRTSDLDAWLSQSIYKSTTQYSTGERL
ncbi:helix-turn-helix transcriptional regulator [Caulobacter sp.]|uniref:helix-turn-helix transcriptional regulator n=1 Tax=Caulobacter sp. TaxID=78 RepID=UPI003BA85683